jgi:hypothetical protein
MPRLISKLEGAKEVIANLRKRRNALAEGVERGIKLANLMLLQESQKLVPVNFGILKASGYVRVTGKGFNTRSTVGYSASYALYVHEAVGMVLKGQPRPGGRGRYWDPQGRAQAKFLEEPARRHRPGMLRIIREESKIRP